MSRAQFYSCLKLIGAYQATVPLRQELISSTITLPLPKFSWTTASNSGGGGELSNGSSAQNHPNLIEAACRAAAAAANQDPDTLSQLEPSTDSEVEHTDSVNGGCGGGGGGTSGGGGGSSSTGGGGTSGRQRHRRGGDGSPEAWSTASDSPTPTNSVTERPWAKNTLWQGLFCEEQRQLLGTEEESSDRHSSDDDNETADLEQLYQITAEQREYYLTQFRAVQPDPNGLLAGITARMFFEKSRIPVEELRHIWKLCDVTRDGALSLGEFTAAMHLVVLRRNNIPLPPHLPACLMPATIFGGGGAATTSAAHPIPCGPPEADLLHLDDDVVGGTTMNDLSSSYKRMIPAVPVDGGGAVIISNHGISHQAPNSSPIISITSSSSTKSTTPIAINNLDPPTAGTATTTTTTTTATTSSPQQPPPPPPPTMPRTGGGSKESDWMSQSKEWTKFTESPTSNVSSPGPKPVNFDMQRTAQAVVSDPLILHPVPVRVTPICSSSTIETVMDGGGDETHPPPPRIINVNAATLAFDTATATAAAIMRDNEASPKHHSFSNQRDSLQNELRAIQRPQPKKVPSKNVGAIPPPPQRDQSGGGGGGSSVDYVDAAAASMGPPLLPPSMLSMKKDAPPLPPPRLVFLLIYYIFVV